MHFRCVPYGNSSSPFLLNANLKHKLTTVPQSHVTKELNENLYVADLLSGTDSDKDGCKLIREASSVMSQASLPLVKWVSNREAIPEVLHQEFQDTCVSAEVIKV